MKVTLTFLLLSLLFESGCTLLPEDTIISPDHELTSEICPTWFTPAFIGNSTWCTCDGSKVQGGAVVRCPRRNRVCVQNCPPEKEYGRNKLNVSILTGFCMTHNFETRQTLLALCPYQLSSSSNLTGFFVTFPSNLSDLNDFMCSSAKREGDLCSRCINGTGPGFAEGGRVCACPNKSLLWFYFIFLELLAPTCFFLIVLFCNVRIMHGPLNAFIFFCQVASSLISLQSASLSNTFGVHRTLDIKTVAIEVIGVFYTFWNNQLLISFRFTLGSSMSVMQMKLLQYISALYPSLLVIVTTIIIRLYNHFEGSVVVLAIKRPFTYFARKFQVRIKWNPTNSILHTFATFILLSYSKTILVSFDLLAPTRVYNQSGELDYKVMSYNASVHFLDYHHLPYAVLALCMLTIFCGLPFLVLLLYPMSCFQVLLHKLRVPYSLLRYLRTYTDVYMGCYRFHTESTKLDCRYFAALYFLFRIIFFSCIFFVKYSHLWLALILLCLSISFLFAAIQPYKEKWLNIADSLAFLLAAVVIILYAYDIYVAKVPLWLPNLFIVMPFAYFTVYVSYKIAQRCCRKYRRRAAHVGDFSNGQEDESVLEHGRAREALVETTPLLGPVTVRN